MKVVPEVDLKRYQGKWFEIARLPNRFEKSCERNVTATYTLRSDGGITVLNSCQKADGKTKSIEGRAKLADKRGPNSKLKVTFFWPFYGDYWILELDRDYRWALVGAPDKKYLWILSRTPKLDEGTYQQLLESARGQGFAVSKVVPTPQG